MVPQQGAHEETGAGGKKPREELRDGRDGNKNTLRDLPVCALHSTAPAFNPAGIAPKVASGHVPLPALRRRE